MLISGNKAVKDEREGNICKITEGKDIQMEGVVAHVGIVSVNDGW